MKNVMVKAWEIAREAVNNFGGKVKDFFPQALKMAWEESRAVLAVKKESLLGDTSFCMPTTKLANFLNEQGIKLKADIVNSSVSARKNDIRLVFYPALKDIAREYKDAYYKKITDSIKERFIVDTITVERGRFCVSFNPVQK